MTNVLPISGGDLVDKDTRILMSSLREEVSEARGYVNTAFVDTEAPPSGSKPPLGTRGMIGKRYLENIVSDEDFIQEETGIEGDVVKEAYVPLAIVEQQMNELLGHYATMENMTISSLEALKSQVKETISKNSELQVAASKQLCNDNLDIHTANLKKMHKMNMEKEEKILFLGQQLELALSRYSKESLPVSKDSINDAVNAAIAGPSNAIQLNDSESRSGAPPKNHFKEVSQETTLTSKENAAKESLEITGDLEENESKEDAEGESIDTEDNAAAKRISNDEVKESLDIKAKLEKSRNIEEKAETNVDLKNESIDIEENAATKVSLEIDVNESTNIEENAATKVSLKNESIDNEENAAAKVSLSVAYEESTMESKSTDLKPDHVVPLTPESLHTVQEVVKLQEMIVKLKNELKQVTEAKGIAFSSKQIPNSDIPSSSQIQTTSAAQDLISVNFQSQEGDADMPIEILANVPHENETYVVEVANTELKNEGNELFGTVQDNLRLELQRVAEERDMLLMKLENFEKSVSNKSSAMPGKNHSNVESKDAGVSSLSTTITGDVIPAKEVIESKEEEHTETNSVDISTAVAGQVITTKEVFETKLDENTKSKSMVEEELQLQVQQLKDQLADNSNSKELEKLIKNLKKQLEDAEKVPANSRGDAAAKKLKVAEQSMKEFRGKCNRLEKELTKLQAQASSSSSTSKGSTDTVKLKKEIADLAKSHDKQVQELEKTNRKVVSSLEKEVGTLTESLSREKESNEKNSKLVGDAKVVGTELESVRKSHEELVVKAAALEEVAKAHVELVEQHESLEIAYLEEQKLRKKYFNMMEDMKGKIRVFARCRPMAAYEVERNSRQVVAFQDEFSLSIATEKSTKNFVFDHCFGPSSTQDEIFQDTQNLIQSSLDGFNVCVFAYGQTGSGKTHTMVGSPESPGLVLRSIREIFEYKTKNVGRNELTVKLNIMELYLDQLVDLLHPVLKSAGVVQGQPAKLDIKKDNTGIVFVKGAHTVEVHTEEELVRFFNKANSVRHVASTNMNAGSSRSHLIFTVILENLDCNTKKRNIGKLSLVDLAGSERQDKTGATDDRLKEAMSINKSLSALGDVISALSKGEKFIPYRNNKLTQLMSDSLGGNAKTLMFVNISPADYNAEETTSSLAYASRVKLITNSASKTDESEEVSYLKKVIQELTDSGGKSALLQDSI